MVRFGRGFPLPRQNHLINPVSDVISTTVIYESGLYATTAVGELNVYTSEEEVVAIIGVGAEAAAGEAGVGVIEGAISESALLTGVAGIGVVGIVSTNAADYSPWKHPKGKYPRGRYKKPKPFRDSHYPPGVEFIPMIANSHQYGAWWNVSTITADRINLFHKTTISSDYSIEGRP